MIHQVNCYIFEKKLKVFLSPFVNLHAVLHNRTALNAHFRHQINENDKRKSN